MESYKKIEGYENVLQAFGYWPSFHDGEILMLRLDRRDKGDEGYYSPIMEFIIHGWEMTSEVTSEGFYKLQFGNW